MIIGVRCGSKKVTDTVVSFKNPNYRKHNISNRDINMKLEDFLILRKSGNSEFVGRSTNFYNLDKFLVIFIYGKVEYGEWRDSRNIFCMDLVHLPAPKTNQNKN
jgi:hypothetical protein